MIAAVPFYGFQYQVEIFGYAWFEFFYYLKWFQWKPVTCLGRLLSFYWVLVRKFISSIFILSRSGCQVVSQLKLRSFFSDAKVRWIILWCKCLITNPLMAVVFFSSHCDVLLIIIHGFLNLYDCICKVDRANLLMVDITWILNTQRNLVSVEGYNFGIVS